jgi:hypothetical protein
MLGEEARPLKRARQAFVKSRMEPEARAGDLSTLARAAGSDSFQPEPGL